MAEGQRYPAGQHTMIALRPIVQLFMRACGEVGKYTYYTVSGREAQSTYSIMYNLIVDQEQQLMLLTNQEGTVLLKATGGLNVMSDMLHVGSAIIPTLSTSINSQFLWNSGEKNADEQFFWDETSTLMDFENRHNMPIGVRKRADIKTRKPYVASIMESFRSNCATVHIRDPQLNPWKKAIILMGMVKHYYCTYRMHLLPMPCGILHLLPPGTPSSSLDTIFDNMDHVKFRISCVEDDKARVMDVLHETNNKILMVLFARCDDNLQKLFKFFFTDTYGQTIIQTNSYQAVQQTIVFMNDGEQIGTIGHNENTIRANDGQLLFQIANSPDAENGVNSSALFFPGSTTAAVNYTLDNMNLLHIKMLPLLTIVHKALALQYGAHLANFSSDMWRQVGGPRIDQYRFRKQQQPTMQDQYSFENEQQLATQDQHHFQNQQQPAMQEYKLF